MVPVCFLSWNLTNDFLDKIVYLIITVVMKKNRFFIIGFILLSANHVFGQSLINPKTIDQSIAKKFRGRSEILNMQTVPVKQKLIPSSFPFAFFILPLDNMSCAVPTSECISIPNAASSGNAIAIPNAFGLQPE